MGKVLTVGEIMMRLQPPSYQRIMQANSFDIVFGVIKACKSIIHATKALYNAVKLASFMLFGAFKIHML